MWRAVLALLSPLQLLLVVLGSWRGVVGVERREPDVVDAPRSAGPFVASRRDLRRERVSIEPRAVTGLDRFGSALGAGYGFGLFSLAWAFREDPTWRWTWVVVAALLGALALAVSILTLLGRRVVLRRD